MSVDRAEPWRATCLVFPRLVYKDCPAVPASCACDRRLYHMHQTMQMLQNATKCATMLQNATKCAKMLQNDSRHEQSGDGGRQDDSQRQKYIGARGIFMSVDRAEP